MYVIDIFLKMKKIPRLKRLWKSDFSHQHNHCLKNLSGYNNIEMKLLEKMLSRPPWRARHWWEGGQDHGTDSKQEVGKGGGQEEGQLCARTFRNGIIE